MTVVDSRQGPGTLSLGTLTGAGCQMGNVRLVPSQDEEDGTPTLCDPKPPPLVTESWALEGTAVQDWEDAAGFVEFCRTNSGQVVTFEWVPSTSVVPVVTYSGSVQVRAVEFGGDVGPQNTSDYTFPVVGELTRTEV
jgi:hypothetical protein